eukprot:m.31552 g.31552  ORF g.31552 m.31552 type:complete len:796 (+) comp31512_c0_seq5:230-2617(+)
MEKYENMGLVGEGSYGIVMKCRHRESGQLVAIKKFIESEDDRMVKKIALREVRMLKQLHHENLVNLLDVFRRKKRLFLVFEFVDHTILDDLERNPTGLDEVAAKRCIWQVIRGIDFCHNHSIIHRDVKPENVLVSKAGVVKLCDFGFARTIAGPGEAYTDYVATRWYRAPELLVGDTSYGKAVDVWAIGCLLAEMLTGEPLFPGDSDIDQLHHITRCFGNLIQRHKEIFMRNPLFVGLRLPDVKSVESLSRKFPRISPSSHLAIKKCLRLEPRERLSCTGLLQDEYFKRDGFSEKVIPEVKAKIRKEIEDNPLLKRIGIKLSDDPPPAPLAAAAATPQTETARHQTDKDSLIVKERTAHRAAPPVQRVSVIDSPAAAVGLSSTKSPPVFTGRSLEKRTDVTVSSHVAEEGRTMGKVPKKKKDKKKESHAVKVKQHSKDKDTGSHHESRKVEKYHYMKKMTVPPLATVTLMDHRNHVNTADMAALALAAGEEQSHASKPSVAVAPTVKTMPASSGAGASNGKVPLKMPAPPSLSLSSAMPSLPYYNKYSQMDNAMATDGHRSSSSMAESVHVTNAVSITTLASRSNHGESRTPGPAGSVIASGPAPLPPQVSTGPSSPPIQIELIPSTTKAFKSGGKILKKSILKDSKHKVHVHHHSNQVTLPQLDERARTSNPQLMSTAPAHSTMQTSLHKKSVLSPMPSHSHYQSHHDSSSFKGSSPFTNPVSVATCCSCYLLIVSTYVMSFVWLDLPHVSPSLWSQVRTRSGQGKRDQSPLCTVRGVAVRRRRRRRHHSVELS